MNKLYTLLEGKESVFQGCLTMPNIVNKDRNAEIIYFPITPSINLVLIFSPKSSIWLTMYKLSLYFTLYSSPTPSVNLSTPPYALGLQCLFFSLIPILQLQKDIYLNFFTPIFKSISTTFYMALLLC